ncbi:Ig-like domain-containing protein [Leptobacterium sp. I13]|uniref:Ig-like domain-containing protein n=1 Tax=Leptobacterium meishanense TaxID=3128904 RepID=UPI0030EEB896
MLINCAKRGTPNGGDRDTMPPKMVKASPEINTTDFTEKKIRIYFDEYIKFKDLQKQLIVSPPLNQLPEIKPQGGASKFVEIKIKDTLKENTTYVFNFGQSIVDNNEENPYPFFKYVFSTGNYIDSLAVSGVVKDAEKKNPDTFVSVLLYEVDSTYTDSIVYKNLPTYVTNTLDSAATFQLTNLKAGKYMLVGLKDVANNFLFNQKTDKIGFLKDFIEVPTDSVYTLTLFKEVTDYKVSKPVLVSKNRVLFGYEGEDAYEKMTVELLTKTPDTFKYKIIKDREKDTLHYWFTPFDVDSLVFKVSHSQKTDTFSVKIKELYRDSLVLSGMQRGDILFNNPFKIASNIPLIKKDDRNILLIKSDSANVDFDTVIDTLSNELLVNWNIRPNEKYILQLLPNALTDFYGNTNDTLNYYLSSKSYADLGNISISLRNVSSYPIIIQLTDEKGVVKAEQYVEKTLPSYDFRFLNPGKYHIRVVFDTNKNGKWDTGNYLQKLQPERISYYPDLLELRANWELQQVFTLE